MKKHINIQNKNATPLNEKKNAENNRIEHKQRKYFRKYKVRRHVYVIA